MAEAFIEQRLAAMEREEARLKMEKTSDEDAKSPTVSFANQNNSGCVKKTGRRGRRPSKVDVKVKLERSRQSARECRARKKLRYQYIEELVTDRERAILALRKELETCRKWCHKIDQGHVPSELPRMLLDSMEVPVSCCDGHKCDGKYGTSSNG